jgi:hypothetical protein
MTATIADQPLDGPARKNRKDPFWDAGAAVARGARIIPANGRQARRAASRPAAATIFPTGQVMPQAVVRDRDGYLRVYYDKIGVKFQSYEHWLSSGARPPNAVPISH